MLDSLQSALASNQLVSGGIMLAALGLVAMWLREFPVRLVQWGKHFFVTTLAVDSREELMFPALVEYMDSREALRRINNFTVRAVRQQGSSYQSLHDELQQGGRPEPLFSPGEGFHVFVLDGRLMWMKREVQVGVTVVEKITSISSAAKPARCRAPVSASMPRVTACAMNWSLDSSKLVSFAYSSMASAVWRVLTLALP